MVPAFRPLLPTNTSVVKAQPPVVLAKKPPVASNITVLSPGSLQPGQPLTQQPTQNPRVTQLKEKSTTSGTTTATEASSLEEEEEAAAPGGIKPDPEDPEWGSRKQQKTSRPSSQSTSPSHLKLFAGLIEGRTRNEQQSVGLSFEIQRTLS